MTSNTHPFRTVITCDDIRSEIGNKKSLMGVFSGDIIALSMPARIQVAFYIEYVPTSARDVVEMSLFVDDEQVMDAKMEVMAATTATTPDNFATLIIPKGIVKFDRPGTLSMKAAVNGGEQHQIVHKKVTLTQSS